MIRHTVSEFASLTGYPHSVTSYTKDARYTDSPLVGLGAEITAFAVLDTLCSGKPHEKLSSDVTGILAQGRELNAFTAKV